jgi:hypothetical protein
VVDHVGVLGPIETIQMNQEPQICDGTQALLVNGYWSEWDSELRYLLFITVSTRTGPNYFKVAIVKFPNQT